MALSLASMLVLSALFDNTFMLLDVVSCDVFMIVANVVPRPSTAYHGIIEKFLLTSQCSETVRSLRRKAENATTAAAPVRLHCRSHAPPSPISHGDHTSASKGHIGCGATASPRLAHAQHSFSGTSAF